MERSIALKRLSKMFGKKFGYRVDPTAPTAEQRAAAREELTEAIAERNAVRAKLEARYKEILGADQDYQALSRATKAANERVSNLSGKTRHKKITVGVDSGLFFVVKAEGDSWEEIFDVLKERENQ